MTNEGFKFDERERRILKDLLADYATKHTVSVSCVIGVIEELLTERLDRPEGMSEDLAKRNV